MNLPLGERAESPEGLLLALLIGVLFGVLLERGGLGDARKLAGQFTLREMTVLKVLLTAMLTAMLGLFWLARFGLLDAAALQVPVTYLRPQLVAGLIFGVGFAMSGLCPGTACVATATGRLDGLAACFGLLAGVTLFAEGFTRIAGFAYSSSIGRAQLAGMLGISGGAAILLVTLFGLTAFGIAEALEQRRQPQPPASGRRRALRRWSPALLLLALAAAAAMQSGDPLGGYRAPDMLAELRAEGETIRLVHPWQLADWLMNRRLAPLIVEVPAPDAPRGDALPGRRISDPSQLPASERERAPLVLLTPDGEIPLPVYRQWRAAYPEHTYVLSGGMAGWARLVLFPDLARLRAAPLELQERLRRASRFFGGEPRNEDPSLLRRGYGREGC